jgi:hypothetical protein
MECPICYNDSATYKIQCGSSTPHMICESCEQQWRLKPIATRTGRIMSCPYCRTEEKNFSSRTSKSYENELTAVYEELYKTKNEVALARYPSATRLSPSQVLRFRRYARENNDFGIYARARLLLSDIASPPSTEPIVISTVSPVSRIIPIPTNMDTIDTSNSSVRRNNDSIHGTTRTGSRSDATLHDTRGSVSTTLKEWCQSGKSETCTTKSKTARKCSTCQLKVCRKCRSCIDCM